MSDFKNSEKDALWRWPELSASLGQPQEAGPDIARVVIDSRQVQQGDLFVALAGDPGPRFNPSYRSNIDGHDFVADAADRGAVGAMVSHAWQGNAGSLALIRVEDTYDGLWELGYRARARLSGDVVAITGSSGKTTAKGFISSALGGYAPPGSLNNHIGVPLSLANAPSDLTAGVFEVGTNHPGEIAPLSKMVSPDVAVLLNVHNAHIENFENRSALIDEKVSIFNGLSDRSMSVSDQALGLDFGLQFGKAEGAHARLIALQGDAVEIEFFGTRVLAKVPGGGWHRASTVAATLLVCKLLDRDLAKACELPDTLIPAGRGNAHRIGSHTIYDDSYNANPESMQAALNSFLQGDTSQRKIAVIGEMLELGELANAAHLELKPLLEAFDEVVCVGEGTSSLAKALQASWHAVATDSLAQELAGSLTEPSRILVKGSNRVFWSKGFVNQLLENIN